MSLLQVLAGADPTVVLAIGVGLGMAIMYLMGMTKSDKDADREKASSKGKSGGLPTSQQALQLIKDRRSIMPKDYLDAVDAPVTDSELETILEAANWAPTHQKTEPWRYVVMSGPDAISSYLKYLDEWYAAHSDTLSEESTTKFRNKLADVSKQWPTRLSHLVLIAMKRKALPDKLLPEWEEICATACSVQNFHLMATALGVGAFWSSHTWCKDARDSPEMKKHFGFEPEDRIFGAMTLGRYDEKREFRSARGPIKKKTQYRDVI